MAAADPCDAEVLMVSAAHGATQFGIATDWEFGEEPTDLKIPGEGVLGPTCRPLIRNDALASVGFLVGPPIAVDTNASLVLTAKQADGGTKAYTITTMKARGYRQVFDRDAPPAKWSQAFAHVGSMATSPIS